MVVYSGNTEVANPLPSITSLCVESEDGCWDAAGTVTFCLGGSVVSEGKGERSTRKPSVSASLMTSSSALVGIWVTARTRRDKESPGVFAYQP